MNEEKMIDKLKGTLAFDTSVLIELVFSTSRGNKIKHLLEANQIDAHVTDLSICELAYILCRKIGWTEGKVRVENLKGSNYLAITPIGDLIPSASKYKCRRAISLADCFCLSLSKKLDCPALFVRERELEKEMAKNEFDVKIILI